MTNKYRKYKTYSAGVISVVMGCVVGVVRGYAPRLNGEVQKGDGGIPIQTKRDYSNVATRQMLCVTLETNPPTSKNTRPTDKVTNMMIR